MYHSGKSTFRLSNFKCFQNFLGKNSSHQLDTNIFLGPIINHQSHRTHFQTLPTLDLFLSSAFAHSAACIWRIFTAHSRLHVHRRHQGLKVVETTPFVSDVTGGKKTCRKFKGSLGRLNKVQNGRLEDVSHEIFEEKNRRTLVTWSFENYVEKDFLHPWTIQSSQNLEN